MLSENAFTALSINMGETHYLKQLARIKQHLEAGDCYQVNFTHQLSAAYSDPGLSPLQLFALLTRRQPSPHAVYFESPNLTLCSVSPELFFSLEGDKISMEPMKGTRIRGPDQKRDEALRQELLDSEKERAENLMIVDMVRNDLGKIAHPGTVQVDELFHILPLPSLWQQVSKVSARTDASLTEIFRALFPCASITGAPKRQAMDIIAELEAEPRGVYTGAIGVVRPTQQMHFSVAIRNLVLNNASDEMRYGVGSGVVWDSDPDEEWRETLDKAQIVRQQSQPAFQLLETMAYHPDEGIALLDFHLQRLAVAAANFDYSIDLEMIREKLSAVSSPKPLRLRLLVDECGEMELQQLSLNQGDHNIKLRLCNFSVSSTDPFLQHKTTHRAVYDQASAQCDGADDVILVNERGELTETCIYNLYLQLNGELVTPARESGLLAGTYRRLMLETGKARESVLTVEDLNRAEAIYVSNSVRGLLPAELLNQVKHSKAG